MSLAETKNRIAWIDMAKGYGMLAVIIAHICSGPLHGWIYTFHMPLFFFLSGYVFSNNDKFNVFINKKAQSLLIPYFSLGIPMVVFKVLYSLYQKTFTIDLTVEIIKNFIFQKRLWTLWYIACLFFLNIIFCFITKFAKNNISKAVIVVGMAFIGLLYYRSGGEPLPWNIDVCFTAVPFFFGGYILKQYTDKMEKILSKKSVSFVLFIAFGLMNAVFGYLNIRTTGKGLEMFNSEYANPIFTYISAFAGIFAVILFSKFFTVKPIKYIGKNSLIYYAWHQTIMIPVTEIGLRIIGLTTPYDITLPYYWIYKFLQLSIIIIVLTVVTAIFEKTKLKILLGKSNKP